MTRFHVGIWLCRNREKCHSAYAIFHHVEIPGRNGISSHGSFNRYPHDCQRPCISWRMTHLRRRRSIGGLQIVKPLEPRATRRSRVCARCESGQAPSRPIAGTQSPSHRRGSLRRQGPDRMPRRGLINVTRLSQLNSTGFNFDYRGDDLNGTCIKWGCRPLRHGKLRGGVFLMRTARKTRRGSRWGSERCSAKHAGMVVADAGTARDSRSGQCA